MEGYQSLDRILSFLNSIGFNFSNDRGMIEHCREGRNLLKVIVEVIKHFEPAYLRSILAIECHRICEDLDRHRESLPIISDFLVVREVFRATGFEFRLTDFIHVERKDKEQYVPAPRVQAILSHLLLIYNWNKHIQNVNNAALGKLKLLLKENRTVTEKLDQVTAQLTEVERVKVMERPSFEEKTKAIAEVREELARIRAGKAEMAALRGVREKELIDKTREYEQCVYRIQSLEIELANARKQLSINAPEVRKEKLRQDAALQEAIARQQRLSLYLIRLRALMESRFSLLDTNISRLNGLAALDVLDSRNHELRAFADKLKADEKRSREVLRRLEEEIQAHERDIQQQDSREENESELIAQLKAKRRKLKHALEVKRTESRVLSEGVNNIVKTLRSLRNDVDEQDRKDSDAAQAAMQEMRRIEREFADWRRRVDSALQQTHEPFNLGLFQQQGSPFRP